MSSAVGRLVIDPTQQTEIQGRRVFLVMGVCFVDHVTAQVQKELARIVTGKEQAVIPGVCFSDS